MSSFSIPYSIERITSMLTIPFYFLADMFITILLSFVYTLQRTYEYMFLSVSSPRRLPLPYIKERNPHLKINMLTNLQVHVLQCALYLAVEQRDISFSTLKLLTHNPKSTYKVTSYLDRIRNTIKSISPSNPCVLSLLQYDADLDIMIHYLKNDIEKHNLIDQLKHNQSVIIAKEHALYDVYFSHTTPSNIIYDSSALIETQMAYLQRHGQHVASSINIINRELLRIKHKISDLAFYTLQQSTNLHDFASISQLHQRLLNLQQCRLYRLINYYLIHRYVHALKINLAIISESNTSQGNKIQRLFAKDRFQAKHIEGLSKEYIANITNCKKICNRCSNTYCNVIQPISTIMNNLQTFRLSRLSLYKQVVTNNYGKLPVNHGISLFMYPRSMTNTKLIYHIPRK